MNKISKAIIWFIWGKPLREVYAHATIWQQVKYWVRRLCWRFFQVTTLIVVITGIAYSGRYLWPRTVYSNSERQVPIDNLGPKIEELKNEVLTKLQKCESAGHTEDDGILVFDSNNKASIGVFQFQKTTVQHYMKSLHGKDVTAKESVLIALDADKARQLASDIIFTTEKGLSNWTNCANRLNLRGEVTLIEKLEK